MFAPARFEISASNAPSYIPVAAVEYGLVEKSSSGGGIDDDTTSTDSARGDTAAYGDTATGAVDDDDGDAPTEEYGEVGVRTAGEDTGEDIGDDAGDGDARDEPLE